MPGFNGEGFDDLVAYLSRLDGRPDNPFRARHLRRQNELPGAVPFDRVRNPNAADWPTYNG